jgi:hypothetical protein
MSKNRKRNKSRKSSVKHQKNREKVPVKPPHETIMTKVVEDKTNNASKDLKETEDFKNVAQSIFFLVQAAQIVVPWLKKLVKWFLE